MRPQPGSRLRTLFRPRPAVGIEVKPVTAFDVQVQAKLEALASDVADIKRLITGLLATVVAAVIVSVIVALIK